MATGRVETIEEYASRRDRDLNGTNPQPDTYFLLQRFIAVFPAFAAERIRELVGRTEGELAEMVAQDTERKIWSPAFRSGVNADQPQESDLEAAASFARTFAGAAVEVRDLRTLAQRVVLGKMAAQIGSPGQTEGQAIIALRQAIKDTVLEGWRASPRIFDRLPGRASDAFRRRFFERAFLAQRLALAEILAEKQPKDRERRLLAVVEQYASTPLGFLRADSATRRSWIAEARGRARSAPKRARQAQDIATLSEERYRTIVRALSPTYLTDRGGGKKADWPGEWRDASLFASLIVGGTRLGPLYKTENKVLALFTIQGSERTPKQIGDALRELRRRNQDAKHIRSDICQRDRGFAPTLDSNILANAECVMLDIQKALDGHTPN